MKNKGKIQDLFQDEELFNQINESDVVFPLFFKNRYNNIYVRYQDENKFEEITISKENESFRGNILFGFNELLHDLKYDLKTWFYLIYRNQVQITEEEYNSVFEKLINGRLEFFSNESECIYIEKELNEQQKNIKHKWRPSY